MEEIKGDRYLKQLIDSQQNGFIKVITGIPCFGNYMIFKGNKTLQNRLWGHTPKPILFFLRATSMGTMSSGVIRRRSL